MAWMSRKQVRSQPTQSYAERELQKLLDHYETRMQRLNEEYLRQMGEHIRDIGTLWPSDVHRLAQTRRMNQNLQQIKRKIASAAGNFSEETTVRPQRSQARFPIGITSASGSVAARRNTFAL